MRLALPALLMLCVCQPLFGADWLVVANDRVRRVELDKSSIMPSDAGSKVAWGRIVLSDDQAKAYGYRSVRALNRYDCRSHSFIIVKRVYISDDERTMREDKVEDSRPISVQTGTVDDRFFSEVCKPASVADLRKTAKEVADRVERAVPEDKPAVRRADIRLANETPPAEPEHGKTADKTAQTTSSSSRASSVTAKAASSVAVSSKAANSSEAPAFKMPSKAELRAMAEADRKAAGISGPAAESGPAGEASASSSSVSNAPIVIPSRRPARAAIRVMSSSSAHSSARSVTSAASSSAMPVVLDPHWSYEGADGPENWGKLSPAYAQCDKGTRQSPIDIRDGIKVDQEAIQFDYKPSYFRIVDNGHTIQVDYGAGSRITIMGRTYELVQFHFHHPAEERVNGQAFAMVAHLVHRDAEGRLAVVAVLLQSGQSNPFIQALWNSLPLEKDDGYQPRTAIQIADLLPDERGYFSYIGSLTTPPCTEGVLWLVMKKPVQLSAEQIAVFSRFYSNNARPLQNAGSRIVKESR